MEILTYHKVKLLQEKISPVDPDLAWIAAGIVGDLVILDCTDIVIRSNILSRIVIFRGEGLSLILFNQKNYLGAELVRDLPVISNTGSFNPVLESTGDFYNGPLAKYKVMDQIEEKIGIWLTNQIGKDSPKDCTSTFPIDEVSA